MAFSKAPLAGGHDGQLLEMPGYGVFCNGSSEGCQHGGPLLVPRTLPSPAPRLGSGWFYGERLRDGETGWFPEDFARSITSRVTVEGNVRRMERLRVETDV